MTSSDDNYTASVFQDIRRISVEVVRTGLPVMFGYTAIDYLVNGQTMPAMTNGLLAIYGYISGAGIDIVERACRPAEDEGRFYAGTDLERKVDAVMSTPYSNVRRKFLKRVDR